MVENGKKHRIISHPIIHFPTSEGVSEVSSVEQANECMAQANECVEQANKRMDKRVAQYSNLYFWLFWPTAPWNEEYGDQLRGASEERGEDE